MKELIKEFNKICREQNMPYIIDDDYNEDEMYKILYFISCFQNEYLNEIIFTKILPTLKPKNNVQKIHYIMMSMDDAPC
jgi:hypothetical protein